MADSSIRSENLHDFSPLSQACIKALTDKMEDKRKLAASEIEKMTVEFANNSEMINKLIMVLGKKFCLSHNPNIRKGGLLGLAAVMVGFKNSLTEPPFKMIEDIIRPILTCFLDPDPRVRYYACESLYNVTKVANDNVLGLFDCIFDGLSRLVADSEQGVRGGAELLDRLLKDIIVENPSFDMNSLIPTIEDRIYSTNPFTRMFIISWVRFLDSKIDLLIYLPQLLEGLFNCLEDSTEEIKASTLNLLSEFLNKIVSRSTDQLDISSLIVTVLKHARIEREETVQYTAIAWLRQFIDLLEPRELIAITPEILKAILPCLAYNNTADGSITSSRDRMSPPIYNQRNTLQQSPNRDNICGISSLVNTSLLNQVTSILKTSNNNESTSRDLEPILEVLTRELQRHEHHTIRLAVLDWFKALRVAEPDLIFASSLLQKLMLTLLDTLEDDSDLVVKNALRVLSDVFCSETNDEAQTITTSHSDDSIQPQRDDDNLDIDAKKKSRIPPSPSKTNIANAKKVAIAIGDTSGSTNIIKFLQALCKTFLDKEKIFEKRGDFIILNLCSMLKQDVVYRSFAEILRDEKTNLEFAYNLVQKLNVILLTTQPLYRLRSRLSNDDDSDMVALFHNLYYAWCHSPIAALTLCLLTKNYKLANELVIALSQTDINVKTLTQIHWLIQLIESPVFASLRMRLVYVYGMNEWYLIQSLYGLLMILPQSDAFKTLSQRLDPVHRCMCAQNYFKPTHVVNTPTAQTTHRLTVTGATGVTNKEPKKTTSTVSLESLMKHFNAIQLQHSKLNPTLE